MFTYPKNTVALNPGTLFQRTSLQNAYQGCSPPPTRKSSEPTAKNTHEGATTLCIAISNSYLFTSANGYSHVSKNIKQHKTAPAGMQCSASLEQLVGQMTCFGGHAPFLRDLRKLIFSLTCELSVCRCEQLKVTYGNERGDCALLCVFCACLHIR